MTETVNNIFSYDRLRRFTLIMQSLTFCAYLPSAKCDDQYYSQGATPVSVQQKQQNQTSKAHDFICVQNQNCMRVRLFLGSQQLPGNQWRHQEVIRHGKEIAIARCKVAHCNRRFVHIKQNTAFKLSALQELVHIIVTI